MTHTRAEQTAKLGRRSAGYQAILARNELIRREKRAGTPDAEIARRYGVGISTVGQIHVGDSGRR